MLTFTFPWALGLGLSLLLIALFYFLRMRFRRQSVSSTFLWARLVKVNDGGARLRWRSVLLLALQLLAVAALVLALAGLQAVLQATDKPGVLYVVDTSASMAAQKGVREAVLADQKRRAGGGPVALFVGADKEILETDENGLAAALNAVVITDGEFVEAAAAQRLGTWLQTRGGTWTAVLVSDGGLDEGGTRLASLLEGRWSPLDFASPAPNLGVTDLRWLDNGKLQVTLFSTLDRPQEADVVLSWNSEEQGRLRPTLPPGASTTLWTPESTAAREGLWQARLVGDDALESDDAFTLSVEASRPLQVLHLGAADPYLRAAFPGARYLDREGTGTEDGPWDLVIADRAVPEGWKGPLVLWGALPAQAPVFWGEAVAGPVTAQTAGHPLSRWVPWNEVTVTAGRALAAQPGTTVLAEAGGWPVAVFWEEQGTPRLALGVGTSGSNLGLTPVLPVLMKNLRQMILPQEHNPNAANLRVGQSVLRAGSAAWRITSATAPSGAAALETVRRGELWELTPREAGTFTWVDGDRTGVLAVNRPASESDTTPRAWAAGTADSTPPPDGQRAQAYAVAPWLAVLALAFLLLEWRLWNGRLWSGRFESRGNRALAALRLGAVAAVLLAFAGLALPWPTTDRNLTVLIDTSASLGPELVEQERQAALRLLDTLAPTDHVALIAFAKTPQIVAGFQLRDRAQATLERVSLVGDGGDGTDIGAALEAGSVLLSGRAGASSQILFTDGRTTAGGDLGSLSPEARRFPVSAVPLGRPLGGLLAQGLDVPDAVRPGERAPVRWRATNDQPTTVQLDLVVDGRLVEQRTVSLGAGEASADFAVEAGSSGTRTIEVIAHDARGEVLPAGRASGLLSVSGRTSVLVIRGPETASGLAAALAKQGLPVLVREASGLPDSAVGYQDLSAVVLDNVPAPSLTGDQQAALGRWVSGGGGLFVVGGTNALGRGEYYASGLEALLPVQTDNRQRLQFTRSRLLFVVDHSGSMSETVGQTTKLEAAIGGIADSLNQLQAQDEVGLIQFDSEAHWLLPFTPLSQRAQVVRALGTFSQGGGTDLTKALNEVVEAFGHPGPVKRHVILMTDGQTGGEEQFFQDFTDTMKAAQVSMTVIGIGEQVNDTLLGRLAEGSDGVYYRARGDEIPALLHNETMRVTREQIQEGLFSPLVNAHDPVLDLGGAPPALSGYLVTRAKPLARVRAQVRRADGNLDPLYAEWRYGAGKVAVFTSDSGRRWMAPWSGLPEYNRLWAQAVRSLEAGERDQGLRLEVRTASGVAHLVVEAIDETGRLRTGANLVAALQGRSTPLRETAPGRYEAQLPLPETGLQLIAVNERTGPARTWAWTWNPAGTELARGGADWSGLGRLTASTGGQLEPLASPRPPAPRWSWAPLALRDVLLALALVLFVLELGVRSTSLGQWEAARAAFGAWWADQARPWTKANAAAPPRDEAEVERRTRDAYKYLAQRKRPGA